MLDYSAFSSRFPPSTQSSRHEDRCHRKGHVQKAQVFQPLREIMYDSIKSKYIKSGDNHLQADDNQYEADESLGILQKGNCARRVHLTC